MYTYIYLYIYLARTAFQEEFTDLLVFKNYVHNWEIWCHINDVFNQFCCDFGYVPTANNAGMYTKLWTEDDNEGASKGH